MGRIQKRRKRKKSHKMTKLRNKGSIEGFKVSKTLEVHNLTLYKKTVHLLNVFHFVIVVGPTDLFQTIYVLYNYIFQCIRSSKSVTI